MQLWKRPLAPLGVSRPHTLRGQLKGVPGLGLEPQLPNVTMEDRNAQEVTFAKSAFRSENTALDRCDAASKAVIDERCGKILGLEVGSADKADLLCIWMQQTLQQL